MAITSNVTETKNVRDNHLVTHNLPLRELDLTMMNPFFSNLGIKLATRRRDNHKTVTVKISVRFWKD